MNGFRFPMSNNFSFKNTSRFNSFTDYIKNRFGGRLQKLSIDAGFTCPNRDGTSGWGGCTYCLNDAFNPSYCNPSKPVSQQLKEGIEFHEKRYRRAKNYIAYFQAYSNTYGHVDILEKIYEEALSFPGIMGLIIGTRPDCISDEILNYLGDLNEKYFVSIEYGVESIYDRTLERINRGHDFASSEEAIIKTAGKKIHAGIHLIFGLPGENPEMMLAEAEVISRLPVSSVKFHQLQIIKNTFMEKELLEKPQDFYLFSLDEYVDFVIRFTEYLNPSIMIDRFLSEVPPGFLATKGWGLRRYDQVLEMIKKRYEFLDTRQGRLYDRKEKSSI